MSVKKVCILKYVKRKTKATCRFFYLASEAWIVCRLLSKVKTELKNINNLFVWLWDWHFYHSCLPIDGRIIFWILKNLTLRDTLSLTLRDTLRRTPKVISNQNLFSRFQLWCWFWCWPLQKNQAIWLALKILGTQDFPLQPGWSGASSISQKVPNPYPWESPPHQIYIL